MSEKHILYEEDLYKPLYKYFTDRDYVVKSEVQNCDITAIKEDVLIIVEMKLRLNLELITQAALRQRISQNVYVAIPKPSGRTIYSKRWKDLCYLLRRLELGLIVVTPLKEDLVEVLFDPVPFSIEKSRRKSNKKRNLLLREFDERYGDYNTGGSKGKKLVTSYREKAMHIACCLVKYGPLSPRQLKALGTCDKKTSGILEKNYYGWFKRISRGVYEITEQGIYDLDKYDQLKDYYMEKLDGKCE